MPSVKYVQVQPCLEMEDMVAPCLTSEADYFGVYTGEPGGYDWVADFHDVQAARDYAHTLAAEHAAAVVDLTKTV